MRQCNEEVIHDFLWHAPPLNPQEGQSPCPCCSSTFASLNSLMEVTSAELSSPAYWDRCDHPLPPVSTKMQLFVNARVLTMDDDFSQTDSLAIKEGRILATGQAAKDIADSNTETIDCQGRFILPGFIEPHMHFLPIASLAQFEDVGPFRYSSVDAALERLTEVSKGFTTGEWIMGRQFDPSLQEGADTLTKEMLDTVSDTHPVFVYNASLHFAYCNSVALKIAGITRDTPDHSGSSYERDEAGEPNGVLQGAVAMASVIRHNPAMRSYDLAEGCLSVCAKASSLGITTFCDQATGMSRGVSEPELYHALADSGQMSTRLRYSLSYALEERWDECGIAYGDGDEMVRAVGWKIVSDGSNQGYSGLQREAYHSRSGKGIAYVEPERLIDMVRERAAKGWPLVIHANGDKAIDNTLDAYEAAFKAGLLTNTPCRIEHCSILHDDQIERISQMGLSPSFLIGHVYYWGKAMRDEVFGVHKSKLLDRTAACEEKGIRWTLHSDEPVTEMGPLRCIENAVTRNMWKEPGSKLAAEECISVEAALRAMTRDAAWQCHSDHEIGSLEPGKLADFVVLEKDPREVPTDEIAEIRVLETWMGGRKVYSASGES